MNIGSLFSGIGGMELGFEREGFETKWFIENNEYCKAVLKKNFPGVPVYGDIREINFGELKKVDILTGGFPCQDISQANPRGKGIAGERSGLWSYYAEAIREIRPKYAVIENVPTLANRGLNVVLRDIAEAGYDAEWFTLRASDFGALHRRERLFIVAYPTSARMEGNDGVGLQTVEERGEQMGAREFERNTSANSNGVGIQAQRQVHKGKSNFEGGVTPDINHQRQLQLQRGKQDIGQRDNNGLKGRFITHDWHERIQRFCKESLQGQQGFSWCQDVRRIEDLHGRSNIPEPLFRGGRDGFPFWMERIKCCGNAVVPQVAQFIARRIKEIEK